MLHSQRISVARSDEPDGLNTVQVPRILREI